MAIAPTVLVRDVSNNPVAGVAVTFGVTGGGGAVAPTTPVATNASGIATLTSWTLGTVAGANTMSATATGLAGSPVSFTATGTAGAGTKLVVVQQPSTTAQNAIAFAQQPTVQVQDAAGNAVAGVRSVAVAIASGGVDAGWHHPRQHGRKRTGDVQWPPDYRDGRGPDAAVLERRADECGFRQHIADRRQRDPDCA